MRTMMLSLLLIALVLSACTRPPAATTSAPPPPESPPGAAPRRVNWSTEQDFGSVAFRITFNLTGPRVCNYEFYSQYDGGNGRQGPVGLAVYDFGKVRIHQLGWFRILGGGAHVGSVDLRQKPGPNDGAAVRFGGDRVPLEPGPGMVLFAGRESTPWPSNPTAASVSFACDGPIDGLRLEVSRNVTLFDETMLDGGVGVTPIVGPSLSVADAITATTSGTSVEFLAGHHVGVAQVAYQHPGGTRECTLMPFTFWAEVADHMVRGTPIRAPLCHFRGVNGTQAVAVSRAAVGEATAIPNVFWGLLVGFEPAERLADVAGLPKTEGTAPAGASE